MTSVDINFANVFDANPRPISCMRLNDKRKLLALYRGGDFGSIELWNVAHQPCLIKQLIHLELMSGKPSVESIVWVKDRLFSAGLHGFIIEHDMKTGKIKNKAMATSGPVWCLAVKGDETQIAAGTEDGFINIFDVVGDSLIYLKVLDRQEGRVLCVDWSPCGNYIASGSVDSVRLWDVEKGHAIQRLITGRSKKKETIVWSIIMMDNMTLVSGDSRGIVSFWDGRVGVLKFKIVTHKADILTLKLSQDKTQLYAAGVDPIVIIMNKIGNTEKWVKSHPRAMHTNDVMTLESYGNKLFSGGTDSDFVMSSFPPKIVTKIPHLPPQSSFSISEGRMLVKKEASVNIWKLPTLDTELKKLLEFQTKGEEYVFSACLSSNGRLFAISTLKYVRVFLLEEFLNDSVEPSAKVKRLRLIDEQAVIPNHFWHLSFLSDKQLFGLSSDGRKVLFLKVNSDDSSVYVSDCIPGPLVDESDSDSKDFGTVDSFETACDGAHFYINSDNNIMVYSVDGDDLSFEILCTVPNYYACVTSVSFHPHKSLLLLTFSDHCVQVYDYLQGKIIFSEKIKKKFDDLHPLIASSWIDDGAGAILLQADGMYMVQMSVSEEPVKKSRKGATNSQETTERYEFTIKESTGKQKYLAALKTCMKGTSLVAVEINPNSILEKLPPSFAKKRFGA